MTSTLVSALVMALITTVIGMYIRNKIWGITNKPTNPIQYGRSWAAYMAFIVPMSSIHFFIKQDFTEALIKFLISIIAFPIAAFIGGYAYGYLKEKTSSSKTLKDTTENDKAYEQALNEIISNNLEISSWSKALANSNGDEPKAKSIYIQLRVSRILNTNHQKKYEPAKKQSPQIPKYLKDNFTEIAVVTVFITLIVLLINLSPNKKNKWEFFYSYQDGTNKYVNLNSIKKTSDGFYEVITGWETNGGDVKNKHAVTERYIHNCSNRSWRLIERIEYKTSLQVEMKKDDVLSEKIYKESWFPDIDKNETKWDTYDEMQKIALYGYPVLEKYNIMTTEQIKKAKEYPQSLLNLFNIVCK